MFTDWYGQQSCTAGRAAFITGQSPIRTGLTKVGLPGADIGLQRRRSERRRSSEAARLRHRPVRQEPPGRQGRVPADRARLRRVLRQPLSPQRRGRAGEPRLSEGPRVQEEVRPARRAVHRQDATVDPHRQGRQAEIEDTGPLTKKRMETVDEEFTRRRAGLHRPAGQGEQAVLLLLQLHAHARLHPPQAGERGQDRAWASIPTAWSSTTACRPVAQEARRPRHRRQHHRRLHHRQRRRGHDLARRRHHAVPRREGHELGRRLPRADASSAGPASSSPARSSTTSAPTRTCSRPSPPRPASRTSSRR